MYMNTNELYIDKVVNIPGASNESQSKSLSGTGITSYTFTFSPPVGYRSAVYTANLTLTNPSSAFMSSFKCETYIVASGTYRHIHDFPYSNLNATLKQRCYTKDGADPGVGQGGSGSFSFTYDISSYVRVA